MRRGAAALLTLLIAGGARAAEERAVYRAAGQDARLFDQYDNDGYSLAVTPAADGSLELGSVFPTLRWSAAQDFR